MKESKKDEERGEGGAMGGWGLRADFNTPGTERTGPADNVTIIDALT